jgi:hypothetical protein
MEIGTPTIVALCALLLLFANLSFYFGYKCDRLERENDELRRKISQEGHRA